MYRVIVSTENDLVYTSPALANFSGAREMLVTQLLGTAENDWGVQANEIDDVVSRAEVLAEDNFGEPFFLGMYVHLIVEEKLDTPE